MHLGPILMNNRVKVGENLSIRIGTALVAQGVTDVTPTVGNNVVIGVGAKNYWWSKHSGWYCGWCKCRS